ncbi:SMP-30/gluconolactonase/LRE family protein [Flavihumibacter sp. UBA7668]|uniref:SMP-30/gluconolactonase/LRE family protein n=1 Tax=Flavihumibacter sp. UBA7668 TaxID=1946542 RepID=UPI0025C56DA9|nr:SMP-30/gluconolactonase/LRE family protein [Flavihumibacter sp. UBA7668]
MKLHLNKWALITAVLLSGTGMAQPPEQLHKSVILTPVNSFTSGVEGPAVDAKGNLYAVNFEKQGTIGQVKPDGSAVLWLTLPEGSIANGIRFTSRGQMLLADYTGHNVWLVNPLTKKMKVLAHEPRMNQPNDLAIDNRDRVYASDPNWKAGTGQLWRIDPNGKTHLLDTMGTANGVEVSPDNKKLYVNESVQRKVWVYDLSPDGSVKNKQLFYEFSDYGMDGMRCDQQGNLYITRFGKGTVVILGPDGTKLNEITLIGKRPTNIAFGGPDGRTAYVTLQDQGNIETFRVEFPGREFKSAKKKSSKK